MPDLPIVTLQRLVRALDEIKVPYAVIGGVAVSIRSVPRFTSDVDAAYRLRGTRRWDTSRPFDQPRLKEHAR